MDLIRLLRRLARENQVQRDLIALIHDGARAGCHLADVKLQHARNDLEIFVRAGDEFLGRVRLRGVSPKDDDMRKHGASLNNKLAALRREIFKLSLGGQFWLQSTIL